SGLIVVLIASFFSKLIRFFPPIVTGSVVTTIGLTLIPVAINDLAGGQGAEDFGSAVNLFLGFSTLIIILIILKFAKGFFGSIAILTGIIIGTVIGAFFGRVDFTPVLEASWLHLPQVFYFGTSEFHLLPNLTLSLVALDRFVDSSSLYFTLV